VLAAVDRKRRCPIRLVDPRQHIGVTTDDRRIAAPAKIDRPVGLGAGKLAPELKVVDDVAAADDQYALVAERRERASGRQMLFGAQRTVGSSPPSGPSVIVVIGEPWPRNSAGSGNVAPFKWRATAPTQGPVRAR
jgi:hypothetical protein